ncbi:MAG TPA: superoxide dismutase family protein [Candidatus Limnocylindrales bacterium]|nr:superoxide dismutase family protein [Candidatus Limnocylindrales bacterium]
MRVLAAAAIALVVSGLAGCAGTWRDKPRDALSASATLKNKDGQAVGLATLVETTNGVTIVVSANRLSPGPKGVHIHAVGLCEPAGFTSAGDHFNPDGKKHGRLGSGGPHAGDLPNIVIDAGGDGRVEVTTRKVTLRPGTPRSLIAEKGTAMVIHAQEDDEKTDPTGNSGDRIACGAIIPQP